MARRRRLLYRDASGRWRGDGGRFVRAPRVGTRYRDRSNRERQIARNDRGRLVGRPLSEVRARRAAPIPDGARWRDSSGRWRAKVTDRFSDGTTKSHVGFAAAPQPGEYYRDRSGRWRQVGKPGWVRPPTHSRAVGSLRRDLADVTDGPRWAKTTERTAAGHRRISIEAMSADDRASVSEVRDALEIWRQTGAYGELADDDRVLISIELVSADGSRRIRRNLAAAEGGQVALDQAIEMAEDWIATYGDDGYSVAAISITVLA